MSNFKKGDWVRFILDDTHEELFIRRHLIDPFGSFKVVNTREGPDGIFYLDLDVDFGNDWGSDWFKLDKHKTILEVIKDL